MLPLVVLVAIFGLFISGLTIFMMAVDPLYH